MRVSAAFGAGAGVPDAADTAVTYFDGFAMNLSRHEGLQNQYVVPACSALPPAARPGVTSMPQTGSFTLSFTSRLATGPRLLHQGYHGQVLPLPATPGIVCYNLCETAPGEPRHPGRRFRVQTYGIQGLLQDPRR